MVHARFVSVTERSFATTTTTFKEVMGDYIRAKSGGWTEKHRKQFENTLTTYALPVLKSIPIDGVDTQAVLKILRPIWETKNETASRVRGRVEMVLDFATATGLRTGDNPARWKGHLSHLLAKRSSVAPVVHMASISYQDMSGLMVELRSRNVPPNRYDSLVALCRYFTLCTYFNSIKVWPLDKEAVGWSGRLAVLMPITHTSLSSFS